MAAHPLPDDLLRPPAPPGTVLEHGIYRQETAVERAERQRQEAVLEEHRRRSQALAELQARDRERGILKRGLFRGVPAATSNPRPNPRRQAKRQLQESGLSARQIRKRRKALRRQQAACEHVYPEGLSPRRCSRCGQRQPLQAT